MLYIPAPEGGTFASNIGTGVSQAITDYADWLKQKSTRQKEELNVLMNLYSRLPEDKRKPLESRISFLSQELEIPAESLLESGRMSYAASQLQQLQQMAQQTIEPEQRQRLTEAATPYIQALGLPEGIPITTAFPRTVSPEAARAISPELAPIISRMPEQAGQQMIADIVQSQLETQKQVTQFQQNVKQAQDVGLQIKSMTGNVATFEMPSTKPQFEQLIKTFGKENIGFTVDDKGAYVITVKTPESISLEEKIITKQLGPEALSVYLQMRGQKAPLFTATGDVNLSGINTKEDLDLAVKLNPKALPPNILEAYQQEENAVKVLSSIATAQQLTADYAKITSPSPEDAKRYMYNTLEDVFDIQKIDIPDDAKLRRAGYKSLKDHIAQAFTIMNQKNLLKGSVPAALTTIERINFNEYPGYHPDVLQRTMFDLLISRIEY